jgi:hypothetical protein
VSLTAAQVQFVRSLSLDEKVELLRRLRDGAELPALLPDRGATDTDTPTLVVGDS